jgi:two-component system sensor histidine kinase YesM
MAIFKMNTFVKSLTLIILLLIPIIILYAYSYQVSVSVVRQNIENENRNRLAFFIAQMESAVDQLTKFSVIVSRDSDIKKYLAERTAMAPLLQLQRQLRIVEMLNLQILTSVWNSQISLHLLDSREVITTDYSVSYDDNYLQKAQLMKWQHYDSKTSGTYFSMVRTSDIPNLFIEVRFTDDNIKNMLKQLKQDGDSEPFLYRARMDPIVNQMTEPNLVSQIAAYLDLHPIQNAGSTIVSINNKKYMVNYVQSESLGWFLVDYVPLELILSPITMSRTLFYSSIGLLLVLSVLATLLLYRNVQRPIHLLLRGVERIKSGHYSIRLQQQTNNEFNYLFNRFNEMASQIQELIEKVYNEKLRTREATLKMLQSQINPHFLYNCLFYIKSMASLGQNDAVVAMSLNLGEYYRYTTRLENSMTTVQEEMKLVENYLTIQSLRNQRFHYEIDIPETMMNLEIPRLLIQPIVENAIIHGIDKSVEFGIIQVEGKRHDGISRIVVDDNGAGMTDDSIAELQRKIVAPIDDEMGCGLWNVHQRLIYQFKAESGLYISRSPLGGLRVELVWEES